MSAGFRGSSGSGPTGPQRWWLLKTCAWLVLGAPALLALWWTVNGGIGANPLEFLLEWTGIWALRWLVLSLAMTPLRRLTGRPWPIRLRRLTGLFAAFYATVHLLLWVGIGQQFDWDLIVAEVSERIWIMVGMLGWLLLLPLVATSHRAAMRRLGRRWQQLHRLAYVVPLLGLLHYTLSLKADYLQPALHALVLLVLLASRFAWLRPRSVPPPG